MPPPLSAVLTGDLVGSARLPAAAVERAMARLEDGAAAVADWAGQHTRFTRFRGDGWQIWLARPWLCLRAAMAMAAALRAGGAGLASRIAIGIGVAESLGGASLADARGEAFVISGRGLDAMARGQRIALAGAGTGPRDRIIAALMAERAGRWTPPQAEALALALHPREPRQAELAAALAITPQAVAYRLAGAGAGVLREALAQWEEAAAPGMEDEPAAGAESGHG